MATFRAALHCKAFCVAVVLLLAGFVLPAQAQEAGTPPADKLREISRLLADPAVAAWLNGAQAGETKADQTPVPDAEANMQSGYVAESSA